MNRTCFNDYSELFIAAKLVPLVLTPIMRPSKSKGLPVLEKDSIQRVVRDGGIPSLLSVVSSTVTADYVFSIVEPATHFISEKKWGPGGSSGTWIVRIWAKNQKTKAGGRKKVMRVVNDVNYNKHKTKIFGSWELATGGSEQYDLTVQDLCF
ncbi:hypothetical protein H6P81_014348 [Aristolochia fimbriata]|uniref:Uncharacterized protein n=1 Tax=Aristolochia fimbriata TaxID=158543 RepID=A0AAV7EH99_ARIFI|nr:hypothetical protein H6P81_014348 [Aristolochia fimbriata]